MIPAILRGARTFHTSLLVRLMAMFGSRRRRNRSSATYRAPFWAAVALTVAIAVLDAQPWVIDASPSRTGGAPVTTDRHDDIVVVLDYAAIANSGNDFATRDWSAAWINLLEQELGATTLATPSSLTTDMIDRAETLVLTASVSNGLPESLRQRLRRQVLEGMTLVLEQPAGPLRDAYAANGEAGRQRAHEVTLVRGLTDPYTDQLKQLPVDTDYIGSTAPRERATTLLAFDGAPVVYTVPIGDGDAITIEFDVGEQLVGLQQGRPGADFQLQSDAPDATPHTESLAAPALASRPPNASNDPPSTHPDAASTDAADAGAPNPAPGRPDSRDPNSLDSADKGGPSADSGVDRRIPYADLLERFLIWSVLPTASPVVGIWPYPADNQGAVVLTHSDAQLGDRAGWMLEYEVRRGATSTLLTSVDAGLKASGAAVIDRRGGEVGLLWRPAHTPARALRPIGLLGIQPLATPQTLGDQLDAVSQRLPSSHDIHSIRSIDGLWSRRWAGPFRVMEAQNLTFDTSYRPARPGYSWGTGQPFRPMTRRGLPLSVRELPVVFPHAPGLPLDVGPVLRRSQQAHHQTVTVDTPPATFARDPSVVRFERWLELFDDAERFDHWVTDPASYHQFAQARRQTTIGSTFEPVERIPETAGEQLEEARRKLRRERELPTASKPPTSSSSGSEDPTVRRLRIDANATRVDMALVLPERIGGFRFQQARRRATGSAGTAARQLNATRASLSGAPVRRIPLDTGANAIDAYYTADDGESP